MLHTVHDHEQAHEEEERPPLDLGEGISHADRLIAMLLAPGLENAMRQSLLFSDNDPLIFIERPISGTIFALLVAALIVFSWKAIRARPAQNQKGGKN